MDHHCSSLFSPPAYCNSYYPPLPPQPGSLATNQIVARLMAQMNYEEGTGLGKYGHGIIDPINPTKKYGKGGVGKFESSYDSDSDYNTGPPVEPKLERGTGKAEPKAVVNAEEVRAMDTLQRERKAYAAARARERRHEKGKAGRDNLRVHGHQARLEGGPGAERVGEAHIGRPWQSMTYESYQMPGLGEGGTLQEGITSGYTAIKRALKVVREQSESGKLTLGGLIHEFAGVKAKFPEEYRTNSMPYKAISFAAPLLHSQLSRQYSAGHAGSGRISGVPSPDPRPRDGTSLGCVVVERCLLLQATMDSILDEVILPTLVAAADVFRLTTWSSKPSVCVGMWIPHLGHARLRIVYIIISRRLRDHLCGGISDYDYKLALPWKKVFDPAS
uniref:OSJNBa0014K14.6 protein n=1 Tax=Oryza sativa subsp. japonica TaxID=39947 RepID=Q7XQW9_ORYSJ|nr:OSJNBa0014K14.6 [Oryza sativa Japonica Group]